jgi:hypothetical protein
MVDERVPSALYGNICSSAPSRSGVSRSIMRRNRSTSSGQPAGESPVRGDARVPGSEAPVRRREAGCEAGWSDWPVRSIKRSLRRRECSPSLTAKRSRACSNRAKAMERTWEPGAGAEEPLGVRGVERSDGCPGNWGDPPRPRPCGGREQRRPISGSTVKGSAAERESEGVVVVMTVGTTQPGQSEGPLLHLVHGYGREER